MRLRLTAWVAGAVGALLLIAGLVLTAISRHAAERQADNVLHSAAGALRDEMGEGNPSFSDLKTVVAEQSDLFREHLALMQVRHDRVVAQSHRNVPAWPLRHDDRWRTITVPDGTGRLVIGLAFGAQLATLQRQTLELLALSLGILLVTVAGAWLLVGRTLSPIHGLSLQAREAAAHPETRMHPPSRDREVVELVETFNGFLERLAQSSAARARFYTAASHELRTPLQGLLGHLELALSRPRSAEEYRASLQEAYHNTDRLTRLARDLLLLHQLDREDQTPPSEPVDLVELCRRTVGYFTVMTEQRHLELALELPDSTPVELALTHAEMVVRNLIENAVKYARPGTRVEVRLSQAPLALEVFNLAEPLPQEDFERLCEPFYRPERGGPTGGTGLGLAIARTAAERNGWSFGLEQTGGGVRARVVFES